MNLYKIILAFDRQEYNVLAETAPKAIDILKDNVGNGKPIEVNSLILSVQDVIQELRPPF